MQITKVAYTETVAWAEVPDEGPIDKGTFEDIAEIMGRETARFIRKNTRVRKAMATVAEGWGGVIVGFHKGNVRVAYDNGGGCYAPLHHHTFVVA
jgi:hypothetical protein